MIKVDNQNILVMPEAVDRSKFFIPKGFELIELHEKIKRYIMSTYRKLKKSENGFTVYLKARMPDHLHYSEKDDRMNVIGDIILIPKWPRIFYYANAKPDPGAHGFDRLWSGICTPFFMPGDPISKATCRYLLSRM